MSTLSRVGRPRIGIGIDESWSMEALLKATEAGVDGFLREQADSDLILAHFCAGYREVYSGPTSGAPETRLKLGGGTAVYDAAGRLITGIAAAVAEDPAWRPVVIVLATDGEDNSSREWDRAGIAEMITRYREYGWTFIYLGANLDAVAEAAKLGIPAQTALEFSPGKARESFALMSKQVSRIRGGQPALFSASDRKLAIEA